MLQDSILGLVRHGLTSVGGAFIGKGVVTGDQLEVIVAGVVTLLGVLWSLWDKAQRSD